ncbi:MAG: radical SAM protein [Candidatus Omnitrophota bacterium]
MRSSLDFPTHFSIQTTSLCNASCIFCPYPDTKNMFPQRVMDMGLYKRIIDQCSKFNKVERIMLYMNNEPLTDKHLIERINYAKERLPEVSVHLLTNGVLLSETLADRILESRLDWLGISFQGINKDTIEKAMGIPYKSTLERVIRFIDKVKKKKNIKEYLMITFLKHKYLSEDEKEEAIQFWRNKGIERISYFDRPVSRAGNLKDIEKVHNTGDIIGCRSIWAEKMIHIVEDGKVILCCMDWRREVILGDLNNETVYKVWNGRRRQIWESIYGRQEMADDFLCRRCEEAVLNQSLQRPDIMLLNLPPWAQEDPHVGIGYLSSYLRNKGKKINVLDLNKDFFINHPDYRMLWHVENKNFWSNVNTFPLLSKIFSKDIAKAVQAVVSINPVTIGFSVVDPKERVTIEFIKRIKKVLPKTKIILGGPATSTPEQRQIFLDTVGVHIDAFVVGEGEEASLELLQRIGEGGKLSNIPGTVLFSNGKWTESSPYPTDQLEKIPFPTYEEFNMDLYGKSLLVEWSRGCYSRCSFCKNWCIFPYYRAKDPEWVLAELEYHKRTYGIDEFTVVDSILNGDIKKLQGICSLIIKKKLGIKWSGQIAPREDMDCDFFKYMHKAGCCKLQIGVESGSDKVLKSMGKTYNIRVAESAVRYAKRAGIETEIFIIVGFPGEDAMAFKQTCNFIKRNRKYINTIKSINTLHLIAGTEVYERGVDRFNMKPLPKENWHYLWETYDGNNYNIRKERAQKLLDLSAKYGIKVMEANIVEGKECKLGKRTFSFEGEAIEMLKKEINSLQCFTAMNTSRRRKKRSFLQWIGLTFICLCTLGYIIYFWIYMLLYNKVLLGGRKNR